VRKARKSKVPEVHNASSSPDCRQISVLPVFSKLFADFLYHRVYYFLTEHNLIEKDHMVLEKITLPN